MNILNMKYVIEIAKTNSLNKEAQILYVGQHPYEKRQFPIPMWFVIIISLNK